MAYFQVSMLRLATLMVGLFAIKSHSMIMGIFAVLQPYHQHVIWICVYLSRTYYKVADLEIYSIFDAEGSIFVCPEKQHYTYGSLCVCKSTMSVHTRVLFVSGDTFFSSPCQQLWKSTEQI